MLQTQRLKTIFELLEQNKDRELSYNCKVNLSFQEKMNNELHTIIQWKFAWFEVIEWVVIYNLISYSPFNILYWLFKVNIYKKGFFYWDIWSWINNWRTITTRFIIQDIKIFINSLLDFIDLEKATQNTYTKNVQQEDIKNLIKTSKSKSKNYKFQLILSLEDYIYSDIQYYECLKKLEKNYKIEDIQIFNWKIIILLLEIKRQNKEIIFKDNDLFIDDMPVYFQKKNSIIFWLIKLIFNYFQENKTNNVKLYELEEYYKQHIEEYKELKRAKFDYEYLRKWLETKSREIEKKHQVKKPFLGINTSAIICEELKEEK